MFRKFLQYLRYLCAFSLSVIENQDELLVCQVLKFLESQLYLI